MAHRNLVCALFVSLLVVPAMQAAEVSLQDVAVAIRTPAGEVIHGRTDAQGQFDFPTAVAGKYSLFFFPDAPVGNSSKSAAGYSFAGWPYQFSVEAPAAQLSEPVLAEESFAGKEQPVPVIRMDVAVDAPGIVRGSVRLNAPTAAAPQPPKFTKVKVVKGDNTKGCKGDVWISNGMGCGKTTARADSRAAISRPITTMRLAT